MSEEYDRGVQDQRLEGHDVHLKAINGSLEKIATNWSDVKGELSAMRLDFQRLNDAVSANQRTAIATAAAVEAERKSMAEAIEAQRDTSERKWSPVTRAIALITLVTAIAGLVAWLASHIH